MNIIKTYDFWQQCVAGAKPDYHDGDVHLGYFKFKPKSATNGGDPVAIWVEEGAVVRCMIGDREVVDHNNVFNTRADGKDPYTLADLFSWIRKLPVSYDDYSTRMDTGNWPGMNAVVSAQLEQEDAKANGHDSPGAGHNSVPMGAWEELRDQIDALSGEVNKAIKGGAAKTKEVADAAADVAERLGKLYGKADKAREVEKAPYWEKCQQIQEKWRPLLEAAAPYKDVKKVVITPFLIAEDKKRQAKLDAERAEAARLKKEADDAAVAAQRALEAAADEGKTEVPAELVEAAARADEAKALAEEAEKRADTTASTSVKVGTRGRSTSLRTKSEPVLVERRLASAALKDEPGFLAEIDALLVKFAKQVVASGRPLPAGFEIEKSQNAA
jgi:colicin import membrane protein